MDDQASGLSWIERLVVRKIIKYSLKKIENMKGSWKTSLAGWAALVGAVAIAVAYLFDGDPTTKPNPEEIRSALAALGIGIPAWLGFLFAGDGDKKK